MKNNYLQNMIVLKNLPSNLVEEAIVVLKQNKKAKKYQYIDEKAKTIEAREKDDNYIVKEAEMLVNNYIYKMENNKKKEQLNKKITDKYKKMKKYVDSLSIITIIELILLIFK